jgi:hypothetical protein
MAACCVLAMLGLSGCSSDDVAEILGVDPEGETAEAAVEGALNDVVVPLATFVEVATNLLFPSGPTFAGIGCPDTTGWCSDDLAVSCAVGPGGLEFTFDSCVATDGEETITVTGGVNVTGPSQLTLDNLQINGSAGLNGTMTLAPPCDTIWNITADDGTFVTGTLVQCMSDNYPQSTSILVVTAQISGVGTVQMTFTFDGTITATAAVTLDSAPYANCSVNLDTYDASCEGV